MTYDTAALFWHILDIPIRWLNGGRIEAGTEREMELIEVAFWIAIAYAIGSTILNAVGHRARGRQRRWWNDVPSAQQMEGSGSARVVDLRAAEHRIRGASLISAPPDEHPP